MTDGLTKRLKGLSPKELRELAEAAVAEADQRELDVAIKSLKSTISEKTAEVIAGNDPAKVLNFKDYVSAYGGKRPTNTGGENYIGYQEHDARRAKIEKLICQFYDNHPNKPRNDIHIRDLLGIPGIKGLVRGSMRSLASYLRTVRKKPGSRIQYDDSRKYNILPALEYPTIKRVADDLFKKYRVVTSAGVIETLGFTKKYKKSVGMYLKRWGKERGMKTEKGLSMGREWGQCMAYFKGETRPPTTPTEKVKLVVGNKKRIGRVDINKQTRLNLNNRGISIIMQRLGYTSEIKDNKQVYCRK